MPVICILVFAQDRQNMNKMKVWWQACFDHFVQAGSSLQLHLLVGFSLQEQYQYQMEKRRGSGTAFKLSFKLGLGVGSMQNSWKYLWLDSNCQSPAHGYDMVLAIIPPNCKRIQKHLHALVMNGNHVDGFPEGCD